MGALAAEAMAEAIVRAARSAKGIPGYPCGHRSGSASASPTLTPSGDLKVTLHLGLLLGYSVLLVAVGLFLGRRVTTTDDFFVAGRSLGPGLLFATLVAANIGAGSTVGAAGLGYRDGLAAWWWVGSAAIGSLVLAFTVGPRMRRVAAERGFKTVGDFLEHRYGRDVRARHRPPALDRHPRHPRRAAHRPGLGAERGGGGAQVGRAASWAAPWPRPTSPPGVS